jgi:two-component system cell cycle sensor histidine kinase/response regulator CckA
LSAAPTNNLLLVEDSPADARLFREMLSEMGSPDLKFLQAENLNEAETHLRACSVDVILLDLGLPDAQGLEAVRRLRRVAPHVPLIVFRGLDEESLAKSALQDGADDYLIKGQIEGRGLWRAIRYAAERKAAELAQRSAESAQRQAELAQRHSDSQYRELFETNPGPMWVVDVTNLAILSANNAMVLQCGYSVAELLKMTVFDLVTREEIPVLLSKLQASANQATKMGAVGTFKHRKKGGEIVEIEVASSPIVFQGRPARLVLGTDITERNNLEAQLFQARKMESLGRLAGGVAHDLNNLLGVILGYGELALDHIDRDSPAHLKVEAMQKAADRAVVVVRQLLAFSRKQIQRPQMLNLNTVIEDMEDLLARLIGENIRLSIVTGHLGTVKADAGQIEQIIMNLVVNARDAMPQGGQLTISTANVELTAADPRREADSPTGAHVMLEVRDTGCGMNAATQARIFEPFFTTKGPGKGTGLGLATVYGIAKQSGGSVSVQSELGRGTTLRICLPRVEAAPQAHREVKLSGDIPRGWETILLTEDAEPLREVARRFLEQGGYKVLVAEDGITARAASQGYDGPIHLLLTDVVMPGLNGPQLAQSLREERPNLAGLYMSGYTNEALGPHGVLAEGVALVEKPFTRGALLRKLREVLDSHASAPPAAGTALEEHVQAS